MRPAVLPCVAALVTSLAGSELAAREAPPPAGLRLEWSAPAGCPGAREVRELTARVLGRALPGEQPGAVRVQARVTATPRGYTLSIETRSRSGTDLRRLEDARCSVLAEAAAVIAATAVDAGVAPPLRDEPRGAPPRTLPDGGRVLVPLPPGAGPDPGLSPGTGESAAGADPDLSQGTADGEVGDLAPGTADTSAGAELAPGTDPGAAAATDPTAPAPVIDPAAQPDPAPPAAADVPPTKPAPGGPGLVRLGLRLGGVLDLGSVGGPTGGLTLTGAVFRGLWRAELYGLWLAPRTSAIDASTGLRARVDLFAAGARGCVVPRVRTLELPVCGGLEAGVLRGRGVGAPPFRAVTDPLPWVAAGVGPGIAWSPAPRVALIFQAELVVPLLQYAFAVDGDEIYRGAPVAGRATLALELRFRGR